MLLGGGGPFEEHPDDELLELLELWLLLVLPLGELST